MISFLWAELTTIPRPDTPPTRVAMIGCVEGIEVTPILMDKMLGKVPVSMYSDAAKAMMDPANKRDKTLELALKIRYTTPSGKKAVFHGPVLEPEYDYDAGTMNISAIGPEDRMSMAYIVDGDSAISPGIALSGRGFRQLLALAQNRPNQDALNWPSLGIVQGYNTADNSTDLRRLKKGDEIWQDGFINFGQILTAPDWEVETIETDPNLLAIGSVTDSADHVRGSATTTHNLVVSLAGIVGKMRVGLYLDHPSIQDLTIELHSPAGTIATLWDGAEVQNLAGTGGFGQGEPDIDLCFFADKGENIYGSNINATDLPIVGQYFTPSGPPTATFFQEDVTGTWQLVISGATGGTLKLWTLRFQQSEPAYARLNVFNKPSTTDPVVDAIFHKGFGRANAKKLNVTTMGSLVRNQAIIQSEDGTTSVRVDDESRDDYGTRQTYESSGQTDTLTILNAVGDARVAQGKRPPMQLDLQPADDVGQVGLPRLFFDYRVGSHIRGHAKKGHCEHEVISRVVGASLKQLSSGVETTLEVVATINAAGV